MVRPVYQNVYQPVYQVSTTRGKTALLVDTYPPFLSTKTAEMPFGRHLVDTLVDRLNPQFSVFFYILSTSLPKK